MRSWSNEEIQRYLGAPRSCALAYSDSEEVRQGAASGGATTQLAINMVEAGYVDGVLVWDMRLGGERPAAEPRIATTREELLSARTSRYCSVDWPRQGLPLVRSFKGTLAVVTLPCDASYLRRKMRTETELAEKIRCILTLFCGHNSEPELTELVLRKHGAPWPEIERFSYRSGPWRGRLTFCTHRGQKFDLPTSTFTHYQNLHFFSQRKCLGCIDHFGYDSDLSLGDIWSQTERNRDIKPTAVVAQTERGQEVLEHFSGHLVTEPVRPEVVVGGNSRGMTYHYNLTARARAGKLFGIHIPDRMKLPTTPLDRAVAAVGLFNFWISHHPRLKGIVASLPHPVIQAYVVFFKGLQQLSLSLHRPFPPALKFSLIGATLSGNRGAAAMLATTIAQLRQHHPDARFVIHSYFPDADRGLCQDLDVDIVNATPLALATLYLPFALMDRLLAVTGLGWPRAWMPRPARELAQSRALIDLSGVSYCDGREKFLPFNLLCNWPALLLGTPLVKLAQGMGPFEGRINRLCAKWTLRRCERVFARGEESWAECAKLGLGNQLDLAGDVALLFDPEDDLSHENTEFAEQVCETIDRWRHDGRRVVLLALSSVVLNKCRQRGIDYVSQMARVVQEYTGRNWRVVLVAHASREGVASLRNNDLPVVAAVAKKIPARPEEAVIAVNHGLNAAGLRWIIERGDVLIASRFHAMVAGLEAGVPTLVLGWGHKYREVLSQFGCPELALDYGAIDAGHIVDRVDELLDRRAEVIHRMAEKRPQAIAAARRQFEWLAEFVRPEANLCTDERTQE